MDITQAPTTKATASGPVRNAATVSTICISVLGVRTSGTYQA
ncbi:hypothetical protein [Tessaracoccus rhinocerotis]|nr:hypothetical protein [Tessaracoccus rhinocerotis]